MFITGGIMIQRPGVRIGWTVDAGIDRGTLELAQYASWPRNVGSNRSAGIGSDHERDPTSEKTTGQI
jgi:hypothetical protein